MDLKCLADYAGLWQTIGGAILTSATILYGIKRMFRKEQKHEKYLLLKTREVTTFDGKEIYEMTDNAIIKSLADEVDALKQERIKLKEKILGLKKDYKQLSIQAISTIIIMLIGIAFMGVFQQGKKKIEDKKPT